MFIWCLVASPTTRVKRLAASWKMQVMTRKPECMPINVTAQIRGLSKTSPKTSLSLRTIRIFKPLFLFSLVWFGPLLLMMKKRCWLLQWHSIPDYGCWHFRIMEQQTVSFICNHCNKKWDVFPVVRWMQMVSILHWSVICCCFVLHCLTVTRKAVQEAE